jgi:alanyl-tRNA synthetase
MTTNSTANINIGESTSVSFPAGDVEGSSVILAVLPLGDQAVVITRATPFHPVDHTWPDHPADHGTITVGSVVLPVVDCLIGAISTDGGLLQVGEDIPVRRGTEGWHWLVLHVVPAATDDLVGQECRLEVEPERRTALSAGHTACELATLAINQVMADRWRKEVRADVAGQPDFDGSAITTSRILPNESWDTYRLGKSLRKKGFVTEGLADELAGRSERITGLLNGWVDQDASVRIEVDSPGLTDRRWLCLDLQPAPLRILCGGSHVDRTGRLGRVQVELALSADETTMTMHTTVHPAVPS